MQSDRTTTKKKVRFAETVKTPQPSKIPQIDFNSLQNPNKRRLPPRKCQKTPTKKRREELDIDQPLKMKSRLSGVKFLDENLLGISPIVFNDDKVIVDKSPCTAQATFNARIKKIKQSQQLTPAAPTGLTRTKRIRREPNPEVVEYDKVCKEIEEMKSNKIGKTGKRRKLWTFKDPDSDEGENNETQQPAAKKVNIDRKPLRRVDAPNGI